MKITYIPGDHYVSHILKLAISKNAHVFTHERLTPSNVVDLKVWNGKGKKWNTISFIHSTCRLTVLQLHP